MTKNKDKMSEGEENLKKKMVEIMVQAVIEAPELGGAVEKMYTLFQQYKNMLFLDKLNALETKLDKLLGREKS